MFLFVNGVDEFDGTDYETTIRLNIGFYGGKTKSSYSKSVTHIICKTQKHEIVQQVKYIVLLLNVNINTKKKYFNAEFLIGNKG